MPSIGNSSVMAIVTYLDKSGISIDQISRHSGIELRSLESEDARLALKDYVALWHSAIELSKNPALGLEIGKWFDASKVGLVGQVLFHSKTLEDGIKEYVRLYCLVNDAITLTYYIEGSNAVLRFNYINPDYYCIPDIERTLVLSLFRSRYVTEKPIRWSAVRFQHAPPAYSAQYRSTFNFPVYFNEPHCEIVFDREYLNLNSRVRNPYIGSAALRYANDLLKKIFRRSIVDKVNSLIHENIGTGEIDSDFIAARLNMSRQTLYRKLKNEGVSFQQLLEEARYSQARILLSESDTSLTEIALALGFSDVSAFSRAFKRWSGVSPKNFRNHSEELTRIQHSM